MAVSAQPYLPFLTTQLVSPFVDFDTDVIKVMLVETGYTFNNAHQYRSDVVANEVSGDNYTIGGEVITGIFTNTSGGVVSVFGDDTSWGATTIPPGFQATGAVIYKDTGAAATDPVIYFFDFGATITNLSNNITLPWSTTPLASYFSGGTGGGGGGATSLLDLTDVATASPANRNVLVADGSLFYSRPLTEADISDLQSYRLTSAELNDIPDVSITTVTDNEVLAYDTSGFWINQTPAEAGLAEAVHTHDTADVVSGTFADARIAQSNVTQHEAALTLSEGQIESALSTAASFTANNYIFDTNQVVGVGTDNYVLTFDNVSGQISLEDSTLLEVNDLTANVTWANVPDANITQSSVTQHVAAIDHDQLLNFAANEHFTEASIDHVNIQNIGTNTHAQIDTHITTANSHIADTSIHFADAPADAQNYVRVNNTWAIAPTYAFGEYVGAWDASAGTFPVATNQGDWFNVSVAGTVDGQSFIVGDTLIALVDSPSTTIYAANWTTVPNVGITDHTGLTNIGVNTHAQIDTHIADATIHFTEASIDHTAIQNIGTNTHAQIDTHIADSSIHFTQAAISITESQISDLQNYLVNVVEDTTPQLGGNLDVQANQITTSTLNGSITIDPNGTGDVILGNYTFDGDQTVGVGQDNYVMTYDNATGKVSLEAVAVPAEVNDLTAAVTWANVPDANITQSSVTQHEAALTLSESQIEAALAAATAFTANNYVFNVDQAVGAGQDNYVLTYDNGTGEISLEVNPGASGLQNVVEDLTPQLGGTLDTNGFRIGDTNNTIDFNNDTPNGTSYFMPSGSGIHNWYNGTTTSDKIVHTIQQTQTKVYQDLGLLVGYDDAGVTAGGKIQLGADTGVSPQRATITHNGSLSFNIDDGNGTFQFFCEDHSQFITQLDIFGGVKASPYLYLRMTDSAGVGAGPRADINASGAGNDLWLNAGGDIHLNGGGGTPKVDIENSYITASSGPVRILPTGTSNVLLGNLEFDADTPVGAAQDGYVLKYDNATGEIDLTPTDAVLIASGTATNVASLVFTDLVSTYGRYQLVIHDVTPATDGASLNMQVSIDNGSTFVTTATYNWALMFARIRSTGGSANGNEGAWQDTSMRIMSNMGTAVGEDGAAIIDIYDPTNSNHYTRISTRATILSAQPETRTSSVAGEYSATTPVDAFRILMSTGNIATVDYSLYGYRQA